MIETEELKEKRKMESEKNKVKEIIKEYGMLAEPKQIYSTAWDIENKYVIKKYENLTELKRNIEIITILSQENIPVPSIVKTLEGTEYVSDKNEYWIMTTKLKGNNIVGIKDCNDDWFYNMGMILARLHKAFDKCEDKINYWNNSLLGEMESWVSENISKEEIDYLKFWDMQESIDDLRKVYEELPKGLIHRDVHLGNFLFDNNEFSGYIDFDLSQKNIRIFDLCYFMLGLLLEEEENRIGDDVWFEFLKYFVEGYHSEIPLSQVERESIEIVMENIELLFVGYFMGEQDEKAARDSAKLYYFCRGNREKIRRAVDARY